MTCYTAVTKVGVRRQRGSDMFGLLDSQNQTTCVLLYNSQSRIREDFIRSPMVNI
jgi:hypothetical protein